jgi:hypothetical protein
MSKERISNTPLYNQESLEDMYRAIEREVEGQDSLFSPKFADSLPLIQEEDKEASPPRPKSTSLRVFETKYLTKRHRFFKAKVRKDCMDAALEALQSSLKSVVESANGDLHVVKATSATDICAYFISREDADSEEWTRDLELALRDYLVPGSKPILMEMKAAS